ncbi:MAG: alpha/beta hydrolase [Proteobacteria bacterium]|nr:alpha/beta hydrolase [Pseudomonadota bacterium]
MSAAAPLERRIPVGELIPGDQPQAVAASVYLPAQIPAVPTALYCLPGGAMSRGYFDLRADGDFSFAAALTARGHIVVTLDPLGIGDSTRPADGYALTPQVLARANAVAVAAIQSELAEGRLAGRPLGTVRAIGVGHSMGAMLTGVQQAHHETYEGLVLLGFGTKGLVVALSEEEKRYAGDPAGTLENLVRLARLRSPDPYPAVPRTQQGRELFAGSTADRRGVEALNKVRAPLLLTAGLYSMIPGSVLPECARIRVPLLLALGDRDMAGPPHEVPASYPGSSDITLLVLPSTGHAHFLFDSRHQLFARAATWCEATQSR